MELKKFFLAQLERETTATRKAVERVPEGRANTMSSAIKNSRVPPAMRNELREIPMMSKNFAPASANITEIAKAIAVDLPAIFFL